jgi:hypothetical protein
MMDELTDEEFIAKYGFDPNTGEYVNKKQELLADPSEAKFAARKQELKAKDGIDREYLKRIGVKLATDISDPILSEEFQRDKAEQNAKVANRFKSLLTGPVSGVASVAALPGILYAAGRGAYEAATTEDGFVDRFGANLQTEGANARLQGHLEEKRKTYSQQAPDANEEDLDGLMDIYQNSLEFERYRNEQLIPGVRLAAEAGQFTRDILGDKRTSDARSWEDSALEIIGGSAVGLPAKLVSGIGKAVTNTKIGNAVVNNKVGYGALRTAEALTPLTLPLNAKNFTINSIAGITLDQGIRYALGQDTMLSSEQTVEKLGAVAGALGLGAILSGRVGNAAQRLAQQRGMVPQGVTPTPQLDEAFQQGSDEGAQVIAGKALQDQGVGVTPALEDREIYSMPKAITVRTANQVVDDTSVAASMATRAFESESKTQARQRGELIERVASLKLGAGMRDKANFESETLTRAVADEFEALPDEWKNVAMKGSIAHNAEARNRIVESEYYDKQKELQDGRIKAATAKDARQVNQIDKELQEVQEQLRLFTKDDPTVRRQLVDIPRTELRDAEDLFMRAPELEGLRKSLKAANDRIADVAMKSGLVDANTMQQWRTSIPYYFPTVEDPLLGSTGTARFVRALWDQSTKSIADIRSRSGNRPAFSALNKEISVEGEAGRVNILLNPITAFRNYSRNTLQEAYKNAGRTEIIDALTYNQGQPSIYITNSNIAQKEIKGGQSSFTYEQLSSPAIPDEWKNAENIIRIGRNGKIEFWEFGDAEVARMLRADPDQFSAMNNLLYRLPANTFKSATTGALNPAFAITGAIYDVATGTLLRQNSSEYVFGPLQTMFKSIVQSQQLTNAIGRVDVFTPILAMPYHALAGMMEILANRGAKVLAKDLKRNGVMSQLASSLGSTQWEQRVESMLSTTGKMHTNVLIENGLMHSQNLNQVDNVLNTWNALRSKVPRPLLSAWQFYHDILTSVHGSGKRMFFAENYGILQKKYPNGIPKREMEKLQAATQSLSGDMTKRAGSASFRNVEGGMPYANAIRVGTQHMARALTHDIENMTYVYPRLAMAFMGVAGSFWMFESWNEDARDYLWKHTAATDRYRNIRIPTIDTLQQWQDGKDVPFSEDAFYTVKIGPDIAPLIAGAAAFMRGVGLLPNEGKIVSAADDMWSSAIDNFLPVPPPGINFLLAGTTDAQLDFQGLEGRGGNILRQAAGGFVQGQAAENRSSLGGIGKTYSGMLAALFGAQGNYLATAIDAFENARQYSIDEQGRQIQRENSEYIGALKVATTSLINSQVRAIPDYPILWNGVDKEYVQTPVKAIVDKKKQVLQDIRADRDATVGERANAKRKFSANEDGIVERTVQDSRVIAIANKVASFQRAQKGDFAELKEEYTNLSKARADVNVNYTLPVGERLKKVNSLIKLQRENLDQQRMAIEMFEGELQEEFGSSLQSLLGDRSLTIEVVQQLMQEDAKKGYREYLVDRQTADR